MKKAKGQNIVIYLNFNNIISFVYANLDSYASTGEGWDGGEVAAIFFSQPHLLILGFMLLHHPLPVSLSLRGRGDVSNFQI